MDAQVSTFAVCVLCKEFLDTTQPHAIVKHDYAHLHCADEYDARDLGGLPDPGDLMGSEWPEDEEDDLGND